MTFRRRVARFRGALAIPVGVKECILDVTLHFGALCGRNIAQDVLKPLVHFLHIAHSCDEIDLFDLFAVPFTAQRRRTANALRGQGGDLYDLDRARVPLE